MLALMLNESGAAVVAAAADTAVISAVNAAEVAERLHRSFSIDAVRASLRDGLPATVAVDLDLALDAGLMRSVIQVAGLSLGDRFCLALGRRLGCPVLTADRKWLEVASAVGVEVQLIR